MVKAINDAEFASRLNQTIRGFRKMMRIGILPLPINPDARYVSYVWASNVVDAFVAGTYTGPKLTMPRGLPETRLAVDRPRKSAKMPPVKPVSHTEANGDSKKLVTMPWEELAKMNRLASDLRQMIWEYKPKN